MTSVSKELIIKYQIHDNWTEILAGTHFVLVELLDQQDEKIPTIHLARNVLVTSHQSVEVMFFNTVKQYLNEYADTLDAGVIEAIKAGFNEGVGFYTAMRSWPELLTGNPFDRSREPFSSQEKLRTLRNETIHWPARSVVADLADAAYYTALITSQHIYSHFYDWGTSSYSEFANSYPPRVTKYLVKAIQDSKQSPQKKTLSIQDNKILDDNNKKFIISDIISY